MCVVFLCIVVVVYNSFVCRSTLPITRWWKRKNKWQHQRLTERLLHRQTQCVMLPFHHYRFVLVFLNTFILESDIYFVRWYFSYVSKSRRAGRCLRSIQVEVICFLLNLWTSASLSQFICFMLFCGSINQIQRMLQLWLLPHEMQTTMRLVKATERLLYYC